MQIRGRKSEWTRPPLKQNDQDVGEIDDAVAVGIVDHAARSPLPERDQEVAEPDGVVEVQVGGTTAGRPGDAAIRNAVAIEIDERLIKDLPVIDDAVLVAICGPLDPRDAPLSRAGTPHCASSVALTSASHPYGYLH